MKRTISAEVGKGSVNHNSRKFKAENVDGSRTHLNIDYCNERIQTVYHQLFNEALKRYNEKQTRADRRIPNYYEKIRSGNQEKPFHEIILQIGNKEDMSATGEYAELSRQVLDKYYQGFQERNPNLRVFSAHLHMDEATPHIHIDFATYVAPKYLLIDKLEETLKELKTRRPDKKTPYRARVVVVGSEVDDIDFIKLVEETGAYVCADRFCYGSFPGRDPIVLTDDEDALTQICRQYMNRAQCPRYMNMPKMIGRREYVNQLAKEYEADGIIYEQIKFCDPWAYERMLGSHILNDDYGYPVLSVDRPYNIASSGQMRTRVQAFVESMEIKKIQGGKQ